MLAQIHSSGTAAEMRITVKQKGNNEKFNLLLNSCKHPRLVYAALSALVKPSVEQANQVREEGKVSIGEVFALFDVAQSD